MKWTDAIGLAIVLLVILVGLGFLYAANTQVGEAVARQASVCHTNADCVQGQICSNNRCIMPAPNG